MISAGTISAYLAMDTSKFNRSISEALQMLGRLSSSSEWGRTAAERMGSTFGIAAGTIGGTMVNAVNSSISSFRTAVQSYALSMSDASIRVNEKVSSAKAALLSVGSCAGEVGEKSRQVADAIKAPFRSLDSSAYGIMSNVGEGLNRGLSAKKGLIISTAQSIADAVTGTLRSALKIASPSKVMRQIGEQTAQGLSVGLVSGIGDIGRSAEAMAGAVTGRNYSVNTAAGETDSSLAGKLDQLIALISGSEQVMQVDGRTFARLIREYS